MLLPAATGLLFVLMAISHHTLITALALAGTATSLAVLYAVNAPAALSRLSPGSQSNCDTVAGFNVYLCTALSPDMRYRCQGSIAHIGWCHHDGLEWRGEAWAVGSEDRTAFPPQIGGSEATTKALRLRPRLPRTALWAALIFMAAINSYELSTVTGG